MPTETPKKMITNAQGKRVQARYVQREKIISLLAVGVRVDEISSQLCCSKKTIYKMLKDKDFNEQLSQERELISFDAVNLSANIVNSAIDQVAAKINEGDARLAFDFLKEVGALRTTGLSLGMEQKSTGGSSGISVTINVSGQNDTISAKIIDAQCADNDHSITNVTTDYEDVE